MIRYTIIYATVILCGIAQSAMALTTAKCAMNPSGTNTNYYTCVKNLSQSPQPNPPFGWYQVSSTNLNPPAPYVAVNSCSMSTTMYNSSETLPSTYGCGGN